jgi:hypothetical protein
MSGYATYPNKSMYWSKRNDESMPLTDNVRCSCSEITVRHFHLNNYAQSDGSETFKLKPLLNVHLTMFKKHL